MKEHPLPEWAPHMNHTQWSSPPVPFPISAVVDETEEVYGIGARPGKRMSNTKGAPARLGV